MVRKMVGKKMLIGELTQGRELAAQLNQLDPVESREACQALVEKIVSTYDKALSMLNLRGLKRIADQVETFHQTTVGHTNQVLSKDQDFQKKDVSKKRKTVPKWNEQTSVSVCSGDGGEESPKEDGHRWRKYGQKEILGAKFPRAYYRCSHRKTHGCLATKKIQRSDYDSSVFQISYKGLHTCVHHLNLSTTSSSIDIPITDKISKLNTDRATPSEALRNLQQGLKVETEKMNYKEEIFDFSSVSFTPFTQSAENVESELFVNLLKEDPDQMDHCSPLFLSPTTTSGSDFIQFDWQVNDFGLSGAGGVLQSSESEITAADMNLTPTSAFESPFIDLDFCVDQIENFDTTTFLNESLGYFS